MLSNYGETIFNKKLGLKNLIISIIYKYLWYLNFLPTIFAYISLKNFFFITSRILMVEK